MWYKFSKICRQNNITRKIHNIPEISILRRTYFYTILSAYCRKPWIILIEFWTGTQATSLSPSHGLSRVSRLLAMPTPGVSGSGSVSISGSSKVHWNALWRSKMGPRSILERHHIPNVKSDAHRCTLDAWRSLWLCPYFWHWSIYRPHFLWFRYGLPGL